MTSNELFERDASGRVVRLRKAFILFPSQENHSHMLFGGKVLENMDELSGMLATAATGHQAVHVGQEVFFRKPISTGESAIAVAELQVVTEKLIGIHIAVHGGDLRHPDQFSLRYEGIAICVALDAQGTMIRTLTPYSAGTELARATLDVMASQRETLKRLDAARAAERKE